MKIYSEAWEHTQHIDRLATDVETAAAKLGMKTQHQINQTPNGGYSTSTNTLMCKEKGTLTNGLEEQIKSVRKSILIEC
jgi:hypothetical protein